MIEIERDEKSVGGRYRWRMRGKPEICGFSREPLLDACRALNSMGEPPGNEICLLRPGGTDWDLRTTVGYGASKTVKDTLTPRFVPFQSFPGTQPHHRNNDE